MKVSDMFWNASIEELKRGYIEEEDKFTCLLCGKEIVKGMIYQEDKLLFEAEKYMQLHIQKAHESVFEYLIQMDKKLTGLTDHQNTLVRLFYQGKTDAEIKKEMEIGSASTIRNHRFVLKEKERQAKVLLTIMELLKGRDQHSPTFIAPHKTATMIDDRYNVTQDEYEDILKKYFLDDEYKQLKTFPQKKQKQKLVILRELTKQFSSEAIYSEKEVNEILKTNFHDYVTLRRYLIEYGFLDRKSDGSQYWVS